MIFAKFFSPTPHSGLVKNHLYVYAHKGTSEFITTWRIFLPTISAVNIQLARVPVYTRDSCKCSIYQWLSYKCTVCFNYTIQPISIIIACMLQFMISDYAFMMIYYLCESRQNSVNKINKIISKQRKPCNYFFRF